MILGRPHSNLARYGEIPHGDRQDHESLGQEFSRLWLAESKPYALDWTMRRYASVVKRYDDLARRLADARHQAQGGRALPEPEKIGLRLP